MRSFHGNGGFKVYVWRAGGPELNFQVVCGAVYRAVQDRGLRLYEFPKPQTLKLCKGTPTKVLVLDLFWLHTKTAPVAPSRVRGRGLL